MPNFFQLIHLDKLIFIIFLSICKLTIIGNTVATVAVMMEPNNPYIGIIINPKITVTIVPTIFDTKIY